MDQRARWTRARSELVLLVRLRTLPVKVVRHAALVGPLAVTHPLDPCRELLDVGPRGLGELDGRVEAGGVGVEEEHHGKGERLGLAQLIGTRLSGEYTGLTGRRQERQLASSARAPVGERSARAVALWLAAADLLLHTAARVKLGHNKLAVPLVPLCEREPLGREPLRVRAPRRVQHDHGVVRRRAEHGLLVGRAHEHAHVAVEGVTPLRLRLRAEGRRGLTCEGCE